MVLAYWQIGKRIVEDEQGGTKRASYGKSVLKELSDKPNVAMCRILCEADTMGYF